MLCVEPRRVVSKTVSGTTAFAQRKSLSRPLERMEGCDVPFVTWCDRPGRDVIDVSGTVAELAETGTRVHHLSQGVWT